MAQARYHSFMDTSHLLQPDVAALFVGVVGVVLAVIFYYRSKETVKPTIAIERSTIIGEKDDKSTSPGNRLPDAVTIFYAGQEIPTLSKAMVAFWNNGRKTLDRADIAPADPIEVHFKGSDVRVLEVRSITTSRDVINGRFELKDCHIEITFDFLDRGDGLACEVFYSGKDVKARVSGTVKGAVRGIKRRPFGSPVVSELDVPKPLSKMLHKVPASIVVTISGIVYLILGAALISGGVNVTVHGHGAPINWYIVTGGILAGLFGLVNVAIAIWATFFLKMPRKLRLNRLFDTTEGEVNTANGESGN